MPTFLDYWGEAIARSGADGKSVYVPLPITQTLSSNGNLAALGVYGLLLSLIAEGETVTLDVLASYSPKDDRETTRRAVRDLYDLDMIPEIVAADAGALSDPGESENAQR